MLRIELRKGGGELRAQLKVKRDEHKMQHSCESFWGLFFTTVAFFFGCRFTCFLHNRCFLYFYSVYHFNRTHSQIDFIIQKICRTRFLHGVKKCNELYPFPIVLQYTSCKTKVMYHATSSDNETSIKKEGLKPGKNQFVYLTDSPEFYLPARKTWFGNTPVLFLIDVNHLLSLGHNVYGIASENEYITDFVPPECITVFSRMNNGICYDPLSNSFK